MLGPLLALGSAALFGLNSAAARRGVLKGTVLQGLAITVPLGIPILLPAALILGGFGAMLDWSPATFGWMIPAGVVHFVIGRYGNYRASQALGATLSTPIQQTGILVALALAFVFLGETINSVNLLGIALILFGPMLLIKRRKSVEKSGQRKGFEPDYGPGLFWGAVGAIGHGTSPLFIALGLGEAGTLADSAAGGLVSYVAATVVVLAMVAAAGGRGYMSNLDRSSSNWFVLSALAVGLSQLLRYMAFAVAPISVVVPIQRLSAVFRILFGAAINRENEVFDPFVIATILLSILGAAALVIETQFLLDWLGLAGRDHWLGRPLF